MSDGFRGQRGVTLIELMIVISIIGVLLAVAVPAFDEMIKNNRRTTVVNELLTSFMLARSEAAKNGQNVVVCGNTPSGGTSCTGGTNWNYGFMVFLDRNGNGAYDGGAETLFKKYVNDYGNDTVHRRDISVTSSIGATSGHIVFPPFNREATSGTVTVCDRRGAPKAKAVVVEINGRARTSERNLANGALTCP